MSNETIETAHYFHEVWGAKIVPLFGITHDRDGEPVCRCKLGHDCESPGKHPTRAWKDQPSVIPNEYENYGIVSDRIVIIDFDDPNAPVPWELPDTYRVRTRKGYHLYYSWTGAPIRMRIGIVPGVDVKASRGLTVGPYSQRIDGGLYEPVNNLPLAPLPITVAQHCGYALATPDLLDLDTIPETTNSWGWVVLERHREELLNSHQRNNDLFHAVCQVMRAGWCGMDGVEYLKQAAIDAGLSSYEASTCVRSALGSIYQNS